MQYIALGSVDPTDTRPYDNNYHLYGLIESATTVNLLNNGTSVGAVPATGGTPTNGYDVGGHVQPSSPTSGSGTEARYSGRIAEVIYYGTAVTAGTDREQIESYLAMKYGITLPNDYLSSTAASIYSVGAGFDNDIAAIAQDNGSALVQPRSRSINTDSIVTAGNPTGLDDGDFLFWANDDGAAAWTPTDAPANFEILSRRWRFQSTAGDVTTFDIDFDVDDAEFDVPPLTVGTTYYLVLDTNEDGNFSDETPVAMTDQGSGVWQAAGQDGNINLRQFTLATEATPPVAPGGVAGNLQLWLRADTGVMGGATVTQWDDQSGQGNDATTSSASFPALIAGILNFNPGIELEQTNSEYLTSGNSVVPLGDANFTIFVAGSARSMSDGALVDQRPPVRGPTNGIRLVHVRSGILALNTGSAGPATGSYQVDEPFLLAGDYAGGGPGEEVYFNGVPGISPTLITSRAGGAADFLIGARNIFGTIGTFADFNAGEVIVYSDRLSDTNRNSVDTYLAVKYGITLGHDYLDSNGAAIFDLAAAGIYINDIAGLGRDDASTLDQRISRSSNEGTTAGAADTADPILTVSTDTDFTSANPGTRPALTDGQYLVWGHNGVANNVVNTFTVASIPYETLGRIWRYTDTDGVGTVNIQFDVTGLTFNNTLPVLIEDNDGNLGVGSTVNPAAAVVGANTISFAADLADNTSGFFTLALQEPPEVAFALGASTVAEAVGTATVQAALTYPSNLNVTLPYTFNAASTAAGVGVDADYTDTTVGSVTITAGAGSADVQLAITSDTLLEDDETVIIDLGAATNAVNATTNQQHALTITDDDTDTANPGTLIDAPDNAGTTDGDTGTVRVTLVDTNGNPVVPGVNVTFAVASGSATLLTASGVTDVAGQYSTSTGNSVAETATYRVRFDSDGDARPDTLVANGSPASVVFSAGAADAATSTITANPTSIVASGTSTSTITVQLVDASSNNLTTGGDTVVITADVGTISGVTDNGDGTYTATLTSATTAGTATVSATVNTVTLAATATMDFFT
ncbi:MAG: invasin domain 3-containing protein, partial [Gammaproteobacteria bacterium]